VTDALHPEVGGALGLLILGATLVVPNGIAIWRGLRSTAWRFTHGKITADGWSVDFGAQGTRGAGPMFGPTVRYAYVVDGVTYEGTRVSFARTVPVMTGWSKPLFRAPPDIRAGLRTKDRVEVLYDPERPADAVLRPGVSVGFWLLALAGLVTLGLGLSFAMSAFEQLRAPI
jgi:hypothetical protein